MSERYALCLHYMSILHAMPCFLLDFKLEKQWIKPNPPMVLKTVLCLGTVQCVNSNIDRKNAIGGYV
jgi:hypothetical protein